MNRDYEVQRRNKMSVCKICNEPSENDLFSAVTGEPVCSLCKLQYIGGLPTTEQRINDARVRLGLEPGQFLIRDRLAEAIKILGR